MTKKFINKFAAILLIVSLMITSFSQVYASTSDPDSVTIYAKLTQSTYVYTGNTITPKIKVTLSNGRIANTDCYKVTYSTSRKYVGSHQVTITPLKEFASQKKIVLKYKIIPKSTYITGVSKGLRKMTIKWKKNTSQTTGYQIKYYRNNSANDARYKTVNGISKSSQPLYNFISSKNYYFKIRAFKTVNGTKYYSNWSKAKTYKTLGKTVTLPNADTKLKTLTHRDKNNLLILVNKKHGVSEEFYPSNMVTVSKTYATKSDIKLKKSAYSAYKNMSAAAKKNGKYFYITSGFRSYTYQENLYAGYISQYGKSYTNKISAYPGRSEHHTGLAIDVTSASAGWTLSQNFANTSEGKWIKSNAHKYGFIVRYEKNKTSITGYSYEPWHLRYVGKDAASAIYKKGITLEEYLGKI